MMAGASLGALSPRAEMPRGESASAAGRDAEGGAQAPAGGPFAGLLADMKATAQAEATPQATAEATPQATASATPQAQLEASSEAPAPESDEILPSLPIWPGLAAPVAEAAVATPGTAELPELAEPGLAALTSATAEPVSGSSPESSDETPASDTRMPDKARAWGLMLSATGAQAQMPEAGIVVDEAVALPPGIARLLQAQQEAPLDRAPGLQQTPSPSASPVAMAAAMQRGEVAAPVLDTAVLDTQMPQPDAGELAAEVQLAALNADKALAALGEQRAPVPSPMLAEAPSMARLDALMSSNNAQAPLAAGAEAPRPPVPVQQVPLEVMAMIRNLGDQRADARLALHPAELGHIDVDMQQQGQRIEISVVVDNEQSRRLLNDQFAGWRERLGESGFELGRLDVSVRDQSARRENDAQPSGTEIPAESAVNNSAPQTRLLSTSALDIYA